MTFVVSKPPSLKEFSNNLRENKRLHYFWGDREGLLSPDIKYDQESAFKWFEANIVSSWVRLNSFPFSSIHWILC